MMNKIKTQVSNIKSNILVVDTAKMMIGTLVGQLILLISLLVLTKLYSPESFGILASFQSIVSIIWVLGTLKYDLAIPMIANLKERVFLSSATTLIAFSVSILILILGLSVSTFLPIESDKIKETLSQTYLISVSVFLVAFYFINEIFVISKKDFGLVSTAKIIQALVTCGFQILVGFKYSNGLSLILGYIVGYFASVLVLLKETFKHSDEIRDFFQSRGFQNRIMSILGKYKNFPKFSLPSSFANLASTNIPVLLIGTLFSPELAGFFFLAQRVVGMPIEILTNSISQVFLANSTELINSQPAKLLSLFLRIIKTMIIIGIVPFFILSWQGEWLLVAIFGKNWAFTGVLVRVFTIMYFARMITTPLSHVLNVLNLLNIQLYWDFARLITIIIIFGLTWYYKIPIYEFALLYSIVMALLYFSHAYLGYHFLKKKISSIPLH
jgi:O-antigen/teichoic acid export membrane protein